MSKPVKIPNGTLIDTKYFMSKLRVVSSKIVGQRVRYEVERPWQKVGLFKRSTFFIYDDAVITNDSLVKAIKTHSLKTK